MKKIKEGDYISRISYMKVLGTNGSSTTVENEDSLVWQISNDIVNKECISASEYKEEKKVSRTELIDIFSKVGDTVFTVNFDKQSGENRTLIGYLIETENGFGRSNVIDLDIDKDISGSSPKYRIRQVDHRTLNWLIVKGVKYKVK